MSRKAVKPPRFTPPPPPRFTPPPPPLTPLLQPWMQSDGTKLLRQVEASRRTPRMQHPATKPTIHAVLMPIPMLIDWLGSNGAGAGGGKGGGRGRSHVAGGILGGVICGGLGGGAGGRLAHDRWETEDKAPEPWRRIVLAGTHWSNLPSWSDMG